METDWQRSNCYDREIEISNENFAVNITSGRTHHLLMILWIARYAVNCAVRYSTTDKRHHHVHNNTDNNNFECHRMSCV